MFDNVGWIPEVVAMESITLETSKAICVQAAHELSSHSEVMVVAACPHHPRSMTTEMNPFCPDLRSAAHGSLESAESVGLNIGRGRSSFETRKDG